jgi:hypothetical protein
VPLPADARRSSNNLEFDHADIFADLAAIQTQFHHLVRTVPPQRPARRRTAPTPICRRPGAGARMLDAGHVAFGTD